MENNTNKKINYIFREVPAASCDFSWYFDDDGLKEAGGDYCYTLFIIAQSRRRNGFNMAEYKKALEEIIDLYDNYMDIVNDHENKEYNSVLELLTANELIVDSDDKENRVRKFVQLFEDFYDCSYSPWDEGVYYAGTEQYVATYLSLKTRKEWDVASATGYCQGDYVKLVYCKEHYSEGVKHYGEIWLGAAKEFELITLDENDDEYDHEHGFIVADCQVKTNSDYKTLLCDWGCVDVEETQVELISDWHYYTKYDYRKL